MDCSEFLDRFSELEDGLAGREAQEAAEAHLAGCGECRRYRKVFRRGAELLRSLEAPSVPDDFRPRLQHRIYHVEDAQALDRSGSSGTTVVTALGMVALLSAVAWSPAMRSGVPEVESAPVTARPAETAPAVPAALRRYLAREAEAADRPSTGLPSLLYHYSAFGESPSNGSHLRLTGSGID